MFQDPALAPDLTVAENLRLTGSDIGAVRTELAAMDLDGLDLDELVRDVPLPFLRMLDLARALAFDPQLLLLDEITAALPPDLSDRVFAVMRRWKERNRSVLFISHRLAEVRAHCDMCTVLRDGRDVASFVPGEGGEAQIVRRCSGEAANARARRGARCARRRRPPSAIARSSKPSTSAPGGRSTTCRCTWRRARYWAWWRWKARARSCCSTSSPATGAPNGASCGSTARSSRPAIPST